MQGKKLVRPRAGQVWAFHSPEGRHDRIDHVGRGAAGSWHMVCGKLVPMGRATAMWVRWRSRNATITAKELWRHWVYISG